MHNNINRIQPDQLTHTSAKRQAAVRCGAVKPPLNRQEDPRQVGRYFV